VESTDEEAPSPSFSFPLSLKTTIFPKDTMEGRRGGVRWQRHSSRMEDKKEDSGGSSRRRGEREERNRLSTPTIVSM